MQRGRMVLAQHAEAVAMRGEAPQENRRADALRVAVRLCQAKANVRGALSDDKRTTTKKGRLAFCVSEQRFVLRSSGITAMA